MTAIFAYAEGDIAFVVGDSMRTDPLHGLTLAPALKVHEWSGWVVFGQAGNAHHQSALIGDIKLNKGYRPDDDTGFAKAYQDLRKPHYQAALAKNGAKLSNGTVLVAAARTSAVPARLTTVEFSTGNHQVPRVRLARTGPGQATS
ncbi:MAG TPA: hypothetical protein VKI44_20645 [Acetobacteraceae bacterium]|nr:hypothetical protein [Acetobacteraceae bacterium]